MSDNLFDTLGSKDSAKGTENSESTQTTPKKAALENLKANGRGDNLLGMVGEKRISVETEGTSNVGAKNQETSNKVETVGSSSEGDSGAWTVENALKEIKKLREENKSTRLKYAESVEKLKTESEVRVAAREKELENLVKAKEELDTLKSKEEDKKRDLSEKLAHREALVAESRAKLETTEKLYQEKISKLENEVEQFRAESQAQVKVYEQRLVNELESIPDKYKEIANYIVKGAGDPRDALVALNEAKLKGLFEEKTVVVNHSVPGAQEGARANKDKLDAAAQAERSKLTSQQKIGQALKNIRGGEKNSAFRVR